MYLFERARLKQATELHVYDFDDTLFDSPTRPEDWPGTDREWWVSPESLSPPYVPARAEASKKLPAADAAKKSLASGAYTVLVTGRLDVPGMRERLEAILKALGIQMDALFLKDSPGPTARFKQKAVFSLVGNMPSVEKVAMWDDMADNLKAVATAVDDKGLKFDSNLVKAKHQIEARMPDLEELVLALDARLRGTVAGETGEELGEGRKPYPIGTIRDWKGGKVIKTADGWEPYTGVSSEKPPSEPAADGPKQTRLKNDFKPEQAAKALGDFMANPGSPDAQKAVRESLRTLCGDFGMMNRDGPTTLFNKFSTFDESKGKSAVEGVHGWNGEIVVRPKYTKRAQAFLNGGAEAQNFKQVKAMHILVHEAIHGHSPIRMTEFKGRYRLLEEATTEMAARKVMHDAFNVPWGTFASVGGGDEEGKVGAYGQFCKALYEGTKAALKRHGVEVEPDSAWPDFLGEASVQMRRVPPPHDTDKKQYLRRFAKSLPLKQPNEAAQEEVAKAVWMSLKPIRAREKLLTVASKLVQQGLLDPKNPSNAHPEVAAALKKLQDEMDAAAVDWAAYLLGKREAASIDEALESLLQVLQEAGMDLKTAWENDGLPRNDLPLAIAYARVLDGRGELTAAALQDLAMLQNDSVAAAKALNDAVRQYGLSVVPEAAVSANGLVF